MCSDKVPHYLHFYNRVFKVCIECKKEVDKLYLGFYCKNCFLKIFPEYRIDKRGRIKLKRGFIFR